MQNQKKIDSKPEKPEVRKTSKSKGLLTVGTCVGRPLRHDMQQSMPPAVAKTYPCVGKALETIPSTRPPKQGNLSKATNSHMDRKGAVMTKVRTGRQKGLRDRNSPTCTLSQNGYGNSDCKKPEPRLPLRSTHRAKPPSPSTPYNLTSGPGKIPFL